MSSEQAKYDLLPHKAKGRLTMEAANALMKLAWEHAEDEPSFAIDLRRIATWDLAALLWFSLGVKEIRAKGNDVRLILPGSGRKVGRAYGEVKDRQDSSIKSARFLIECNYEVVVRRIGGVKRILVPEQYNFFSSHFGSHKERKDSPNDSDGPLFAFYDFAALNCAIKADDDSEGDGTKEGGYRLEVCRSLVNGRIRELYKAAFSGTFGRECNLPTSSSALFVSRIVGGALESMEQHPNASIGIMIISVSRSRKKLMLAVADDGESICRTILDRYNASYSEHPKLDWDDVISDYRYAARILDYSTRPEVSIIPEGPDIGTYYIKKHALESFNGYMQIITSDVSCFYSGSDTSAFPKCRRLAYRERGNLIKVEIPLDDADE